ncbi:MAG: hypothetical protein ACW99F_15585 [Candidatus Hodarchaeales archaeon]
MITVTIWEFISGHKYVAITMKLVAREQEKGISYNTVLGLHKRGQIQHPTEQLLIGTIPIYPDCQ